ARLYAEANERCAGWARDTNAALIAADLPVRVVQFGTVWTVLFTDPGRYNWLLQYYLRAQGIALSWVGTGRCLASLDYTDDDYHRLTGALVAAAREMARDGWWLARTADPRREQRMKMRVLSEMVGNMVRVPAPLRTFYTEVMRRKDDDHHASHNDKA